MKHTRKGFKQREHGRGASTSTSGSAANGGVKGKDRSLKSDPSEEVTLSFPEFRTVDKNKLICYSSILKKPKDDNMVTMDDLDSLQLELETMLSAVSVRLRDLHNEIDILTNNEDCLKDKKIRVNTGKSMVLRKLDDKPTLKSKPAKDVKLLMAMPVKSKSKSMPLSVEEDDITDHVLSDPSVAESSKIVLPKNDTPNKFWTFVDEYCTEITSDEIKYLEDLKANCEKDSEPAKIPPLGKHYTLRWAAEDLSEDRDSSAGVKLMKRKSTDSPGGNAIGSADNQNISNNNNSDPKELLKKAEKICIGERIPGPLAQRLISALLEENMNISPLHDSGNILGADKQPGLGSDQECESPGKRQKSDNSNSPGSDSKGGENTVPNFVKKLPLYHTSICFERRIRRGLEATGFFEPNSPPQEENDEILKEIKKCQEELRNCAVHNVGQLKRVLDVAHTEMTRNQVRKKLRQIDNEIIEIYRRLSAAKTKNKQISKVEREQAWYFLRERESCQKRFQTLLSNTLS